MQSVIATIVISLALTSCCIAQISEAFVTRTNDLSKMNIWVTTSWRTNGCSLELRQREGNSKPLIKYWSQSLSFGKEKLLEITHHVTVHDKEQWMIQFPSTNYLVMQIDRDLNQVYDMVLVSKSSSLELVDVLVTNKEGWLQHASVSDFEARIAIIDRNKNDIEQADKIIRDALKKFNGQLLHKSAPENKP